MSEHLSKTRDNKHHEHRNVFVCSDGVEERGASIMVKWIKYSTQHNIIIHVCECSTRCLTHCAPVTWDQRVSAAAGARVWVAWDAIVRKMSIRYDEIQSIFLQSNDFSFSVDHLYPNDFNKPSVSDKAQNKIKRLFTN